MLPLISIYEAEPGGNEEQGAHISSRSCLARKLIKGGID